MKILLATSAAAAYGGGIASYNQELIKALGDGNCFYLLASGNEHEVEGYKYTISLYGNNIYDYSFTASLIEKLNSEDFDLIINSNSDFISLAAPFIKAPIIAVAHFVNGLLADCAGHNSEYNNAIIALSYYGKEYLEKKFKIEDQHKVKVVYNFVHPEPVVIDKTNNKRLVIVFPGGTSVKKSIDVVMDVAYRLKKTKHDFLFYWLGNTKLPSANLSIFGVKDTRQMLHGDNRFVLTGNVPREDAERYISSANIFLLPSRGEGCPMTLLEAMRAGCIPIVSDAKHGSRELIEKSNAGFVTKQGDSKAIVRLIEDIIKNHSNYSEYYTITKAFSENELSPDNWSAQMQAVIKDALSKPKLTIELNEEQFKLSSEKYIGFRKQDEKNAKINSVKNRIKMDWLYLRWNGWK